MKVSTLLLVCVAASSSSSSAAAAAMGLAPRIAGGHEAVHGQFPWLVTVELTNHQSTWLLCGGVLVAPQWVLTAAHCLDSERPEWLLVVSGNQRRDYHEGTEQFHLVDYIAQHPNYIFYQKPYVNDVGLLRLSRPATLDTFTQVAPLRSHHFPLYGWCTEAGWGKKAADEGVSQTLQYANVYLQPMQKCEAAYPSLHDPNAICADSLSGGVGFCVGDNGGGLMCWDGWREQYVVSAVLSWRDGCARPGNPAVYMDVAPYAGWIRSVISQPQ